LIVMNSDFGVPETIRTSDLALRRRLLYPTELQGHNNAKSAVNLS
jgi:hypothetical protein